MSDIRLVKYAKLLVDLGVNVKKDQYLIVEASVDCSELVAEVVKIALDKQAKDVIVFYDDPLVDKYRALKVDEQIISEVLPWQAESRNYYLEKGACSLLIKSSYPYLYSEVSQSSASALQKFTNDLRNNIRHYINKDNIQWCICSYPNQVWADSIFPDDKKALDKLFDLIYDICRVNYNDDPSEAWYQHFNQMGKYSSFLNGLSLDRLHFSNKYGTDLTIGLHPNHHWNGGIKEGDDISFIANIPTEEISTSPDKYRVDGRVVATKPLEIGGAIIEDFYFEFKDGKIIHAVAQKNDQVLQSLLNTDDGSRYLGEVALVENKSPISQSGKLFYNTLYDENAACHLAFGKGFPSCIDGIDQISLDSWQEYHLNHSSIHIDFMFGSEDMSIVGYTNDNEEVIIFDEGNFVELP